MGTRYFTSATLDFLQDLEINNEREWFHANKDRFEDDVREPMLAFIGDVAEPLAERISPHLQAAAKKVGGSMFRINRDTRFSNDKSPYKTNVGAYMAHELGRDVAGAPGVYVHLEPGRCFLGGGTYMPPSDALRTLRTAMVDDPDGWVESRDAIGRSWEWGGDSLTRAPKGFEADHPLIDDLRRKSFIVSRPLTEKQVTGTNLLELFIDRAAETRPLMAWICRSLALPF